MCLYQYNIDEFLFFNLNIYYCEQKITISRKKTTSRVLSLF